MKENRLSVKIYKPLTVVFEFTINPINTPRWVQDIEIEETNEWPIKIGTIYRNKSTTGKWCEYTVSAIEENKVFELISKDGNYHVRYSYTPLGDEATEMEYFEWVDRGNLDNPFSQEILEKLKWAIELCTHRVCDGQK